MNAAQLKASILQQAIEGKLVPQLPEEGVVEQIGKEPTKMPFEIPKSWKWVQFEHTCNCLDSMRVPIKQKDRDTLNKHYPYYGATGIIDYIDKYIFDGSFLLIGEDGANLLSKSKDNAFIATGKFWVNNHAHIFDSNNVSELKYLAVVINALNLDIYVTGTAQPKLTQKKLFSIPVPLPPLAEQKRIVAKIEELMPLVEEYGKAYDKLQELNDELPDKLKASILQEAIQGKLVPQLPEDGVVEQIGKAPAEVPFEIPDSWKWVKIKDVFSMQAGKFIKASEIKEVGAYPCYGGNGLRGFVDNSNRKGRFPIIGRQGALCGNIHVVDGEFYATEHAVVVNCGSYGDPDCVGLFLEQMNLNQYATATAQPGLAVKKIEVLPFPLPPLDEQKRIVAKVEALFEQIDLMTK